MAKIVCGSCQRPFEDRWLKQRLVRAHCPNCGFICRDCYVISPRRGIITKHTMCSQCGADLVRLAKPQAKQFQRELEQGRTPSL